LVRIPDSSRTSREVRQPSQKETLPLRALLLLCFLALVTSMVVSGVRDKVHKPNRHGSQGVCYGAGIFRRRNCFSYHVTRRLVRTGHDRQFCGVTRFRRGADLSRHIVRAMGGVLANLFSMGMEILWSSAGERNGDLSIRTQSNERRVDRRRRFCRSAIRYQEAMTAPGHL
jgi:hypothetical protein